MFKLYLRFFSVLNFILFDECFLKVVLRYHNTPFLGLGVGSSGLPSYIALNMKYYFRQIAILVV